LREHWHAHEENNPTQLPILNKNHFKDFRNTTSIRFVIKNGKLYESNTLDEAWPKPQVTGQFWWSNDQP
jgi:hypothetical protein